MKKILLLFVIFLGTSQLSSAQTTGAAALIALDEIDAKISQQMQSIDNLVTNAIGNTGNMILSASARLRKDINETIGNTDKLLRENQVALFNELRVLKDEFNDALEGNLEKLDGTATKVSEALTNFIVTKKEPSVFKFITTTFIQDYSPHYTLKVSGRSFDKSKKVYAKINGKEIKPVQSIYGELIFDIDSAVIKPTQTNKHFVQAKIVFEWEKGFFKRDKVSEYPFIIPITPFNIGTASAFFEQELPERKYSDYLTYSCSCRTSQPGWRGGREESSTSFNILPTNGRRFDISTIEVVRWDQRHGGGHRFNVRTEQQIAGGITCYSESDPYGARGTSYLTFRYKEYETVYKIHQKSILKKQVTSVNPLIFEFPDPIDNKRPNLRYVLIKTYDGKELTLLPNISNKYFSVSINPVTDDVAIQWEH